MYQKWYREFESPLLRNDPKHYREVVVRDVGARGGEIRKTEAVYKTNEVSACRRVRGGSSYERSELET